MGVICSFTICPKIWQTRTWQIFSPRLAPSFQQKFSSTEPQINRSALVSFYRLRKLWLTTNGDALKIQGDILGFVFFVFLFFEKQCWRSLEFLKILKNVTNLTKWFRLCKLRQFNVGKCRNQLNERIPNWNETAQSPTQTAKI